MTVPKTYDLAVIGAGSGGMAAAKRAAGRGLRVAIFETARAGGTCVNAGCVPKKLMVHAARVADTLGEMEGLGWSGGATFDWARLRDAVADELTRLSGRHASKLRDAGIDLFETHARIVGPHGIAGEDGIRIEAGTILLATGAQPILPDIPGIEHAITSDDLFTLPALPARMAIVGGGYIAVEFASMLARFGVAVTLFERGGRLIKPFDGEIAGMLAKSLRDGGVDVRLGQSVDAIARDGDALRLSGPDGAKEDAPYGAVLMAVGRAPNTEGLGLDAAGVRTTEAGHILVDDEGRSSVPSIRAVGDVCERVALTPVAVRGARRVADLLTGEADPLPRPDTVPTAAFTTPECASVGLTEAQAREGGWAVRVERARFRPLAALLSGRGTDVFMKAVIDVETDRMLGFHFFGPHASEAAQMGAMALEAGLTAHQLARTMPLHPSVAEEVIGLGAWEPPARRAAA